MNKRPATQKPTTYKGPRQDRLFVSASLGRLVEPLAQRLTGRQLTALGRMKRDWHLIVGPKLAAACKPENLTFPKDRSDMAVLTLRVRPGDALDLSHGLPRLIERINAHFGFSALASIRLIQGEWAAPTPFTPPPPGRLSRQEAGRLQDIEDPELRATLTRLGQAIAAERPLPAAAPRAMPIATAQKAHSSTEIET